MTAPKLFTIAQDLSKVQIEAQVDEADIGQVASDNAVIFTVDAYADVKFKGQVEQIRLAPVSLQNVVTYTVVIAADNPLGRLLPGMTANVEIVTGEHKQVVVVQSDALRYQPRGSAQAALVRDSWATGVNPLAVADRRGRLLERLKGELELGAEELGKINAALEAEFATLRNAGPPGSAPPVEDIREQVRLRIAKVLRAVLTPEKYKRYEDLQRQRPTGARRATLWAYEEGALVPYEVRLGLSDGSFTEITDGLAEGTNIVLRVREAVP
jgi:HlyD family secretion protein